MVRSKILAWFSVSLVGSCFSSLGDRCGYCFSSPFLPNIEHNFFFSPFRRTRAPHVDARRKRARAMWNSSRYTAVVLRQAATLGPRMLKHRKETKKTYHDQTIHPPDYPTVKLKLFIDKCCNSPRGMPPWGATRDCAFVCMCSRQLPELTAYCTAATVAA